MLGQLVFHLEESLVVSQVTRELLQGLLALLRLPTEETGCQVVALDQVEMFLLHLFPFPGVATISHSPVGLQEEYIYMNKWLFIVVWHLSGRGGHDALSEAVGDLPRELVLSVRLLMPVHPAACFGINPGWPLLSLH